MASIVAELRLTRSELAGKVAVVTGAGQGAGREAALALAGLGARVVVADMAEAQGQETVRLIREAGGEAAYIHTDVSQEGSVARLAMWTLADFGLADILVTNAAVSPGASLLELTPDVWDQSLAATLRGAYLTCRAFVPGMLLKHGGTVVNLVPAGDAARGPAGMAVREGIVGFTRALAAEVKEAGVRVVALEM